MAGRDTKEQRYSNDEDAKRDVPSFIEPLPPLISNPFMRPRPQKGTNLLELFEESAESEEPDLVQVYLRLKPCNLRNNFYEVRSDKCLITSLDTATAGHGRRTQHNVSKMYTFSHIFGPQSNQKEIFEHVVKDNLRKLPNGHSFTLLTYGASGSGKTYTLMGTVNDPGLVPRSLDYVFRVVDAAQQPLYKPSDAGTEMLSVTEQEYELKFMNVLRHVSAPLRDKYRRMSIQLNKDISTMDLTNRTQYYVWVSFVEIYNEAVYDLLQADRKNAPKLLIREDANGNVYLKGVTQAFVRSGEEAYDVMAAGKHNLQVAATGVHARSSRSHCIFTITMLTKTEGGSVRGASVRLCDLAGCERWRNTRNAGARMQESRAINSSLHVLERCLHTLRRRARRNHTHTHTRDATLVPYRESKLTRLLGAGLSGLRGEAVSMVVTVNPAPAAAPETRHVLQLATVARDIQINNTIVDSTFELTRETTIDASEEVMVLQHENERLRFELLQAEAANRELSATMSERQQRSATIMSEVVAETKDSMKQYYESRLAAAHERHQAQMDELIEEYESKLEEMEVSSTESGMVQSLQNKVTELVTQIAILEEKLTTECLAHARAEQEVQHLRACIEERDNEKESNENLIMVSSDSESDIDQDDDPYNETLEPIFKRDNLNITSLNISVEARNIEQSSNESTSFDGVCSIKNNSHDTNISSENLAEGTANRMTQQLHSSIGESQMSNYDLYDHRNISEDNYTKHDENEVNSNIDKITPLPDQHKIKAITSSATKKKHDSLAQFEHLETVAKNCDITPGTRISHAFSNIMSKIKGPYFFMDDSKTKLTNIEMSTELNINPESNLKIGVINSKYISPINKTTDVETEKMRTYSGNISEVEIVGSRENDDLRSPTIVIEDVLANCEPINSNKIVEEIITKASGSTSSTHKFNIATKKNPSIDLFDCYDSPNHNEGKIQSACKSIEKLVLEQQSGCKLISPVVIKVEQSSTLDEHVKSNVIDTYEKNSFLNISNIKVENTIVEFENIYKQTTPRPSSEFELLMSQADNPFASNSNINTEIQELNSNGETLSKIKLKYNLRNKTHAELVEKSDDIGQDVETKKIGTKDETKFGTTVKKRNLKLRRKNQSEDEDRNEDIENNKLQDILNLQKEFSDVTLDVPASKKEVHNMPSPEKDSLDKENLIAGIRSCPAKSITRSRRKLFTPRAEPLEESFEQTGDSNERIRVPRPSYRKTRARRKL